MSEAEQTTLVSLFHTDEHAQAAIADLHEAGIPIDDIETARFDDPESEDSFRNLELPESDLKMLDEGLRSGGTVITIRAAHDLADQAENIFRRHHANKVDERTIDNGYGDDQITLAGVSGGPLRGTAMSMPLAEDEASEDTPVPERCRIRVVSYLSQETLGDGKIPTERSEGNR